MVELVYNFFFIASVFFTNRLIANHYYDTMEDRKRMNKVSYIIALVIYIIMFFNLTIFGRIINWYHTYNLIPFKTIFGYWAFPSAYNTIINILGNIIILMPVQFLIMKIFDIKNFKVSLIVDISLSLLIEIIQLISHAGVFDIDDIILNVLGMSIIYALVMDKHKILLNHKDKIITSIISLVITFFSFEMLSWYHFGDIPTIRVFIRLIIGFMVIEGIIWLVYKIIIRKGIVRLKYHKTK
jgi:glycopeptide antibiotics resistance protein